MANLRAKGAECLCPRYDACQNFQSRRTQNCSATYSLDILRHEPISHTAGVNHCRRRLQCRLFLTRRCRKKISLSQMLFFAGTRTRAALLGSQTHGAGYPGRLSTCPSSPLAHSHTCQGEQSVLWSGTALQKAQDPSFQYKRPWSNCHGGAEPERHGTLLPEAPLEPSHRTARLGKAAA